MDIKYESQFDIRTSITMHIVHYNTIAITVLEIVITIRINIIANSIFQFDAALYAKRYTRIK